MPVKNVQPSELKNHLVGDTLARTADGSMCEWWMKKPTDGE
jgi:hypothetical protein